MKIISWNVNGIRACAKKGFKSFIDEHSPDVLFLQETKVAEADIPDELREPYGYKAIWHSAERKGYSGVAVLSKINPDNVIKGFGIEEFDIEGRVIQAVFGNIYLIGVYFPNGQQGEERLDYKLRFYDALFRYCDELRDMGKQIIVCGDYNTAHTPIDLARPNENDTTSGFMPIEREWVSSLIRRNYIDIFRIHHPNTEKYSWWSYRSSARDKNIGWRIDYFMIDAPLEKNVSSSFILNDVMGSDHCPVGIVLDP
ncbi:MAG: exodeoxyribonuclease III [Candidatus Margulisiibacteriota bacterium]